MHNAIEIRDLRYAYPDDQAAEHVVFEDLNLGHPAGKLRRRAGTQRLRQIDAGKAPERYFAAGGRQRDGLRAGHEAGRKFACHPPAGGHGVPEPR